ncbi:MAG: DUF5666 domain-containing protein [Halioglobus sp.]
MIMPHFLRNLFSTALLVALSSCGGGGGGGVANVTDNHGGIGGSGVTSAGTIDAFGSIFVNGVEFETDEATILIDGLQVSEAELGLGMVVVVSGEIDDSGKNGIAETVVFDEDIEGPVDSIVSDQDGDSLLLTILGLEVIVERTSTVFEGVRFESLMVGDLVEISGFGAEGGQLRATRLERTGVFISGVSEIDLEGIVSGLTETTFLLGQTRVNFANAELEGFPDGMLSDGLVVEVEGTAEGGMINAREVELKSGIEDDFDENEEISIQGQITGFTSISDFLVDRVSVDAGNASLSPASLVLADGAVVEVEGIWDGNILRAEKVEARRGRVELEAKIGAVSQETGSLMLQFAGGTVDVVVDRQTLFDDDTGLANSLLIADLRIGDFIKVEAIAFAEKLLVTRLDRVEDDDDVVQAPVESFVAGRSVTVLGLTFNTQGAEFESRGDVEVSSEAFYSAMEVGALIKIKDEELADGVADEVEFESDEDLDGGIEFGRNEEEDCPEIDEECSEGEEGQELEEEEVEGEEVEEEEVEEEEVEE